MLTSRLAPRVELCFGELREISLYLKRGLSVLYTCGVILSEDNTFKFIQASSSLSAAKCRKSYLQVFHLPPGNVNVYHKGIVIGSKTAISGNVGL